MERTAFVKVRSCSLIVNVTQRLPVTMAVDFGLKKVNRMKKESRIRPRFTQLLARDQRPISSGESSAKRAEEELGLPTAQMQSRDNWQNIRRWECSKTQISYKRHRDEHPESSRSQDKRQHRYRENDHLPYDNQSASQLRGTDAGKKRKREINPLQQPEKIHLYQRKKIIEDREPARKIPRQTTVVLAGTDREKTGNHHNFISRQVIPKEGRWNIPDESEVKKFMMQHVNRRWLTTEDKELLKKTSWRMIQNDWIPLKEFLARPAAEIVSHIHYFYLYIQTLSGLISQHKKIRLDREDKELLYQKWEESSRAFYCLWGYEKCRHDDYFEKISMICNRWSHVHPRQAVGCFAIANAINTIFGQGQANGLFNWIRHGSMRLGRDVGLMFNGLSRMSEHPGCRDAVDALAAVLINHGDLIIHSPEFNLRTISMIFNALSHNPNNYNHQGAIEILSNYICHAGQGLFDAKIFTAQGIANTINALSKWHDLQVCYKAAKCICKALIRRKIDKDNDFTSIHLSMVLNGLSKWIHDDEVKETTISLVKVVISREERNKESTRYDSQATSNILNALSKLPDEHHCRQAANIIAGVIIARSEKIINEKTFSQQQMTNVLNAVCKWPDEPECKQAGVIITKAIIKDRVNLRDRSLYSCQALSNIANAASKWSENGSCCEVIKEISTIIIENHHRLSQKHEFNTISLSTILQAISRTAEIDLCRQSAMLIATELVDRCRQLDQIFFSSYTLSNILNAISKWSNESICQETAKVMAGVVVRRERDLSNESIFSIQALCIIINSLAKWPSEDVCYRASMLVSKALIKRRDKMDDNPDFTRQSLTTAMFGISRWPDDPDAYQAIVTLAKLVLESPRWRSRIDIFTNQELSNMINAVSRWPYDPICARLIVLGANAADDRLGRLADIKQTTAQSLTTIVNSVSKMPDHPACSSLAVKIANFIVNGRIDLAKNNHYRLPHLAAFLNALSKWPEKNICLQAAVITIRHTDPYLPNIQEYTRNKVRIISNLLNSASRWQSSSPCKAFVFKCAKMLGSGGIPFSEMGVIDLIQVVNSVARVAVALNQRDLQYIDSNESVEEIVQFLQNQLREIAAHLYAQPESIDKSDVRMIGVMLKSFSCLGMKSTLRLFAHQVLNHLDHLNETTQLKEDSLEALGNLSAGILPYLRSPELKKYRDKTLQVMEKIQPNIERKLNIYYDNIPDLNRNGYYCPIINGENCDMRRPGMSTYLMLKTYDFISRTWKSSDPGFNFKQRKLRRQQLKDWVSSTLTRVKHFIESDLDEMSWNLIAQIEAGDCVCDALDLQLQAQRDLGPTQRLDTQFDVGQVHQSMRALPIASDVMGSQAGAAQLQFLDIFGQEITDNPHSKENPEANYSFFTRLTEGRLPLIEVELPGRISTYMLARTIRYQNRLWRIDMFGGSHLNPSGPRIYELLVASHTPRRYGRLPAIPLNDSSLDSRFMQQIICKLNPQREDWFRMQRALLEVVPRENVIEGPILIGLQADRPQGAPPVFPLRTAQGHSIQLVSHDGCGFIRASLARRIPVMATAMSAWHAKKVAAGRDQQQSVPHLQLSLLPPQASQHYPRDPDVIEEARSLLVNKLQQGMHLEKNELYDFLAGAGIRGTQGIAIPSADEKVYLPTNKSYFFDQFKGPILLGKPPYDKPNLMPIPEESVASPATGNATAEFLDQCFAFQYSYTAWDESQSVPSSDLPMLHGKGVTIVIDDALWPEDNEAQWIWSREDMKIHSNWIAGRQRDQLPPVLPTAGSLRVKEVFTPGSLIAVPINELKKRDADCDGDKVFVYAGLPKMAQSIARFFEKKYEKYGIPRSFKPPKTAHSSYDETGKYCAGRAAEVLSATYGHELVRRMSTLQFHIWAQSPERIERFAHQVVFGIFEGTYRPLRRSLRHFVDAKPEEYDDLEIPSLVDLQMMASQNYQFAQNPIAQDVAQAIQSELQQFCLPNAQEIVDLQTPGSWQVPPLMDQFFADLSQRYRQAETSRQRLRALLHFYPTALIPPPELLEDGNDPAMVSHRLGYKPDDPVETLRNLLTQGIKVGTDAPKAVTQTSLYLKITDRLERALKSDSDRIQSIPYGKKDLVHSVRNGFDIATKLQQLKESPTLSAGLMEMALTELNDRGLLKKIIGTSKATDHELKNKIKQIARKIHHTAQGYEKLVTRQMHDLVQDHGQLAGLDHRVKSSGSLCEKIAWLMKKDQLSPDQASSAINDSLRYTIVVDHEKFIENYQAIICRLANSGFILTKINNSFLGRHPYFKGINVKLMLRQEDSSPFLLEVQFHTAQTFQLKEQYHDDYKDAHAMQLRDASPAELQLKQAPMRAAFAQIATPPGCENIENWAMPVAVPGSTLGPSVVSTRIH